MPQLLRGGALALPPRAKQTNKLNINKQTAKQTAKGSSTALLDATASSGKFIGKGFGIGDEVLTTIAEGTKSASINAYKIRKVADIALVMTRSVFKSLSSLTRSSISLMGSTSRTSIPMAMIGTNCDFTVRSLPASLSICLLLRLACVAGLAWKLDST